MLGLARISIYIWKFQTDSKNIVIRLVMKLNHTIYGLSQSAQALWSSKLLKAFKTMEFKRSDGNLCCYFEKVDDRLVVCLSWVDDCAFLGQ